MGLVKREPHLYIWDESENSISDWTYLFCKLMVAK